MRSEALLGGLPEALVAVDRDWTYTYVNDRALERIRSRSGVPLTREGVLGRTLWEDPAEPPGAEARRRLLEAMDERRVVSFEPYAGAGGEWIEACAYPSDHGLAIYYRDITARKRADKERDRWARLQRLVAELGQGALAGRALQAVMDEAVTLVGDALDTEPVAIVELLRDEDLLVLRAGVGWWPGAVGTATGHALGESFVGYVARSEEPVVSDDVTADPRFRISAFLAAAAVERRRGGRRGARSPVWRAGRVLPAAPQLLAR